MAHLQFRAPRTRSEPKSSSRKRTKPTSYRAGSAAPMPRQEHERRAAVSRVIALWPHELDDSSHAGRQRVVAKLRRALREERRRGIAGHWSYDLARHVELLRVYRQELAAVTGGVAITPAAPAGANGRRR
jgi:hypothetical protein